MKYTALFLFLMLAGCTTSKDQMYYDTVKSVSKDNTMSQTACWAAISDIAKSGDSGAKVGAIALAEKCKNETLKIESPKRNWLGL
ncbi:hypothetical protein EBS02_00620 [bacterium]|nr:hypothetical protein [bacterium]